MKKDEPIRIDLFPHLMEAQLRFNDIDILGHLNNTVYFSLYDLGKAKYMEEAGLRPVAHKRPACVIADVHCSYFKPILFGDSITIATRCSHLGEKSFTLEQALIDDKGEIRSSCATVMVYINPETGESALLPEDYRKKIETYENC